MNSVEVDTLLAMLQSQFLFDPMRQRLIEQCRRPLADHLAEYRIYLESKGITHKHLRDTVQRVRLMLRLCRASQWQHLSPAGAQVALNKLRTPRPNRKTRGLATINHYLNSVKSFGAWMVTDYRAERSPFLSLKPYNARTDIRRARRPLTIEEAKSLILAATAGPTVAGIPGTERALMYTLACTTGLRAGELESLTRSSFVLVSPVPHVIVEAAYSKHRRRDIVPLRQDVAVLVSAYLDQTPRDERLFRRTGSGNGTRGLKIDLANAGVAYCLGGKYADFHSQRHTFVSNLFNHGATPKEAQTLARHQDPRLTLGRYAHVCERAQRAAIERLPALEAVKKVDPTGPAPTREA